ncbi:MAG: hypothetical protein U0X76_04090 [Bacteroidia bacterium]
MRLKAADDFHKRQEEEARKRAEEGSGVCGYKKVCEGDDKYDACRRSKGLAHLLTSVPESENVVPDRKFLTSR